MVALLAATLLSGCTAPQTRQLLASPPEGLVPVGEIADVPFFPQTRYQCGPAALATVLKYSGFAVTPDELISEVYIPELEGSLQAEMIASARSRGRLVHHLPPNMTALLQEVSAGNPVLILQNLGLNWSPKWHYAVAMGYDLTREELYLRSGIVAHYVQSLDTFELTWARGGYWAIAVMPPDQLPQTGTVLGLVKASQSLSASGQREEAGQVLQAIADRWGDDSLAWMALGNYRYGEGQQNKAEVAFRRATMLSPDSASGWNNLAHILGERGCRTEALEAIHCAIGLESGGSQLQQTRQELQALPLAESVQTSCQPVACPR